MHVVVIEDDAASRKLVALLLTDAGAFVTCCASAEEAIAAIAVEIPVLIVLDLVLPGMGGLVLARRLMADPKTRDIVLVAVTSLTGSEVERLALAAGCKVYVRKPVDTETFASTVGKQLKGMG